MKKILGLLVGFLFLAPILVLPNSAKANYSVDTTCAFMDNTMFENVNAGGGYYQTFYPKENRITSAVLKLGAFLTDSTATLKILNSSDNVLATQSLTVTGANPADPTDYSFDSFSAITVTPGQMYKLVLIKSAGVTLYWYKSTNCNIQGNGYANGTSFPGMDYVFTTYGYTVPTPEPTPTPTTQIAAPTNVAAAYLSGTQKVKVSWDKSSTVDIDGYNIYRSENQTKSFVKVGQTDGKTVEYSDAKIAAKKTYYYYVKTYKGSGESAQSNTASVTTPNTLTTSIGSIATNQTNWFFYLLFGGVGLLLIIFLIVYELKLKKLWANGKKIF